MRARSEAAFWIGLLVSLYVFVRCSDARAEEPACRRVGTEVVCRGADFRLLTDSLIDTRAALTKCRASLVDTQGRLDSCIADGKPLPPAVLTCPTAPPQGWRVDGVWLVVAAGAGLVVGAVAMLAMP